MTPEDLPGGPEGGTPPPESEAAAELNALRARISEVDDALIRLMGERRSLVLQVGATKAHFGLPVLDPAREAQVARRVAERARELGVDEEMARDVIWRIMASAREEQEGRPGGWPDLPDPPPAP